MSPSLSHTHTLAVLSILVLLFVTAYRIYRRQELSENHYSLHSALWDLATLAVPRVFFALVTLVYAYHRARRQVVDGDVDEENDSPFSLYHENGDRKSNSELEAEALEEPFLPQLRRYVRRLSFLNEMSVLATGVLLALKAMARLNVEIGVWDDARPQHPLFWMALAATALLSFLESLYMDSMEGLAGRLGRKRRRNPAAGVAPTWVERISDSLTQPLLSSRENVMQATDASSDAAVEEGRPPVVNENARGDSGIGPDALYTASAKDFFRICEPDKYLILLACVFLLFGGAFQVFIPKFTGAILDALVDTDSPSDSPNSLFLSRWFTTDDASTVGGSITHIPGFIKNIELLLIVSILGGLCAGVRGAIFTMVGARVNTRLRIMLMDSLLSQEIGFYDTTRTGDITSRLSSDTTIVGSSITSQVSIFLRSTVRVIGVLIFMFFISWQLSLLAFLTIPAVSILSKWYGRYLRRLSKLQQKKLADGNSVSESTISSMATVRAFGAETVELDDFEDCMANYLRLNAKAAIATMGYSTLVGALPQLVNALVLFYGGLLVQTDGPGHITGGQLVSFILYLSALSESFNSLGGIYASLVRLAGAADKVLGTYNGGLLESLYLTLASQLSCLELLNRESRVSEPSNVDEGKVELAMQKRKHHLLSVESNRVVRQRALGLYPESCSGEITFSNVEFRYPARPQRVVLDGMNLTIPSGSIVALVGVSGGGKSSIVKLIQQLYEPLQGTVCIDGVPVKELSADWLCRNVSVVSQEPALFARSVRRNIMYGLEGTDAEPSQEEIEVAARLANAADFIESLPKGYDTEVGERGIQLSGGQKQRVAMYVTSTFEDGCRNKSYLTPLCPIFPQCTGPSAKAQNIAGK
jgi:ATP-binding cassette subfamily B (MDR/TAP) protein 9